MTVNFAIVPSPLGRVLVAATPRGLCAVRFGESAAELERELREEFPAATLSRDASLARFVDAALASVREDSDLVQRAAAPQVPKRLDLRGTVFQLRVWQALRQIPRGETLSYSQLAGNMGEPKATRAVARACAMNRVALLVPCHRVVGADGSLTGYRWGVERKKKLLEAESKSLSKRSGC